jgi:FkbM family methyltransferase
MKDTLFKHTIDGFRYKHWTALESIMYFFKGVARELKIAPNFFDNLYYNVWKRRWFKKGEISYFDFKGIKLPDVSEMQNGLQSLKFIYEDVLMFPVFFHDNYDKEVVERMDKLMSEGPYGYTDSEHSFDVSVKKGDIVIDVGAWIGDFTAYAFQKGATVYAFEPSSENFQYLEKTKELNMSDTCEKRKGNIVLVKRGLGAIASEAEIFNYGSGCSIVNDYKTGVNEKVIITTLDAFIDENNIERIDFIKADIEGAERDMLRGATKVLKNCAPKLAICTYHLPDDPKVLEEIILQANPAYKVVHLAHKLFAAVV